MRWTVATYVVLLSYGTVLHLVDLAAGGVEPYPWAPPWLALYLVLLTVLDPLAAGLLALRRRAGLYLACTVFVTDAAANGYALYGLDGGATLEKIGHGVVTVIAASSIVAVLTVARWLHTSRDPKPVGIDPES